MDCSSYMGRDQFGPAYRILFDKDAHAPGTVDQTLTKRMIRLCAETADYLYTGYTPVDVRYRQGSRPELERYVEQVVASCEGSVDRIGEIVRFTAGLETRVRDTAPDDLLFGGTEEDIIRRGSDWCTDVARVACLMCQVAGIPARIVNLFNTAQAYSGHVIIEAYRNGVWGAVDASSAVVYRHGDGTPASTWDLMQNASLIEAHMSGTAWYTEVDQFRDGAVVNYLIQDVGRYDYTVSGMNAYYRAILEMGERGWPGGLRWLYGEDTGWYFQ